jgi:hypothetical protein
MTNVDDCRFIDLPKVGDSRGNLTFIEGNQSIPFEIKRVFYLYDIPTGESRGGHAHKTLHLFFVCPAGSFDVEVDDGQARATFHLNRPSQGLYVPPMLWAVEHTFAPGTVCLVLASDHYDAADYIRDYDEYMLAKVNGR